jgi:hypothetical protein
MLPDVPAFVATDSQNTRSGIKITPVNLSAHLVFSIKDDAISPSPRGLNLMVVVYIWEHKQFKSYTQLQSSNDFGQFLDRGQGFTGAFSGQPCDVALSLAKDHYKLCKKLVFPLRTDGTTNGSTSGTGTVSNGNASPFQKTVNLNLTKYIPKVLQYPVQPVPSPGDPTKDSYPTNSALCMSVGWYNLDLTVASDNLAEPLINCQYVTKLTYKDA